MLNLSKFWAELRFPVKFLLVASAMGFVDAVLLLRSVSQDPMLTEFLSDPMTAPLAAESLTFSLLTPFAVLGWAIWYYFRPPLLKNWERFTIPRILVLAGLFLIFAVLLATTLPPAHLNEAYEDSIEGRIRRHDYAVPDRVAILVMSLCLHLWGLHWVYKARSHPQSEAGRRFVFMLSVGGETGFIIHTIRTIFDPTLIPPPI